MTMTFVILVITIAGFTQGMTGFGFGLVSMPLLLFLMNLNDASALTTLLNVIVCSMTFFSIRHHYSYRQGLGLVVGSCLGVPLGVYALVRVDEAMLLRILGGVLLLFSFNELVLNRVKQSIRLSPQLGFPMGVVSGGLTGAFNMGGPPAVAFIYSQTWSKEQIVAILQVVFGLGTILRLLLMGGTGFLDRPVLVTSLWSVVPLVFAIALGQKIFSRVPQLILKQITFLFLGIMGVKYLFFH
jgi:uncharacterized protein